MMNRIRIIGMALVAVFALSAVAVATASALPSHVYRVEGAKLEAGKSKEILSKVKSGSEFVLKGTGLLGIKSVTKCKKIKLKASEKPVIVGGTPGTSEKELIEFEECTATIGGSKCSSVTVESASTKNELVTILLPTGKKGKLATLFTPTSGSVFSKVKFKSCGLFGSREATVEGSTAAWVRPEATEAVAGELVWNEAEEITEGEKQSGEKYKVGLKSEGNLATLNGEAEVELTEKLKWGAY